MDRDQRVDLSRRKFANNVHWFGLVLALSACGTRREAPGTIPVTPTVTTPEYQRDPIEINLWQSEFNQPTNLVVECLERMKRSQHRELKAAVAKLKPEICTINMETVKATGNQFLGVKASEGESGYMHPVVSVYPVEHFHLHPDFVAVELVRAAKQVDQIRDAFRLAGGNIDQMFKSLEFNRENLAAEAYGVEMETARDLQLMGVQLNENMPKWMKDLQRAYFKSAFNTKDRVWMAEIGRLSEGWKKLS